MLELLDVTGALKQSIFGPIGAEFTDPVRLPMSFTSTRRLRSITNSSFKNIDDVVARSLLMGNLFRTSTFFKKDPTFLPVIEMAINPNSISWKQPKRIVKRDTQEGSVFFHFSNKLGENNDILTLDFRGNTGYINYRGDMGIGASAFSSMVDMKPQTIKKLMMWHNLWNLTRETMILDDGATINEFMIMYSSPVIPSQIMLIGFFSSVMDWTDSADKPFSKDYSFGFTVTNTVPELNSLIQDITTFTTTASAG